MILEDRPYQEAAIEACRASFARGTRRIMLQAATAAGKTVIAAKMIIPAVAKGKRVLFIAERRELIGQAEKKFIEMGLDVGVIIAGRGYRPDAPVQVCSKGTLVERAMKRKKIELPPADLVIPDEAHHTSAGWYQRLFSRYRNSFFIGLSATPARSDGRGLGDFYEDLISVVPTSELIRDGYLVPTKTFAPYRPKDISKLLKGVKSDKNGNYAKGELLRRVDVPQLVGNTVSHWKELGEDRQTVVFASGVSHSIHIRDEFLKKGIRAAHVDGDMPGKERDDILAQIADPGPGGIRVLVNCDIAVEGWNQPIVSCCILAKPTRSYVKFIQMAGRIRRPHPGKVYAVLLDHAGCCYMHGLPDDDIEWTLDKSEKVQDAVKGKLKDPNKAPVCCPHCHAVVCGSICSNCGAKLQKARKSKMKHDEGGKLVEVKRGDVQDFPLEAQQREWNRCLAFAAAKNGNGRMAYAIWRTRYPNSWPDASLYNIPRGPDCERKVVDVFPNFNRKKREEAVPAPVQLPWEQNDLIEL